MNTAGCVILINLTISTLCGGELLLAEATVLSLNLLLSLYLVLEVVDLGNLFA
jgi:hypothetical protein